MSGDDGVAGESSRAVTVKEVDVGAADPGPGDSDDGFTGLRSGPVGTRSDNRPGPSMTMARVMPSPFGTVATAEVPALCEKVEVRP